MDTFLNRVKSWLGRVRDLPLFGSMAEDLLALMDMLRDYRAGIYKSLPRGVLIAAAIALGYALCPIDLILDVIPFAGYLDDAAILALMLEFFVARDILKYRAWRSELRATGRKALRDNRVAELLTLVGGQRLAAAFLTEDKQLRLLLCDPEEKRIPLRCRSVLADIGESRLTALGVESWEELGSFYTEVFQDPRLPWSVLGPRPFMPEYDPAAKTDEFIIS